MKEFELFVKRLEKGVAPSDTVESLCAALRIDCRILEECVEDCLGIEAYKLVECYKFDIPMPFL